MPTIQEIASLLPPPREGTHVADPTASGLVRTHTGIGSQAGLTPQEAANLRPALSYYENLAVGVGGGCVETAALMPVLTWKFCAQEGRALPKLPHTLASIAPWCHATSRGGDGSGEVVESRALWVESSRLRPSAALPSSTPDERPVGRRLIKRRAASSLGPASGKVLRLPLG